MRGGGIPSGLTALLSKLGLAGGLGATKEGLAKKEAKGMEGEAGPDKGALLGEEGALLTGLGYNGADRRTTLKNVAERANLERFLEEMKGDAPEPKAAEGDKGGDKGEAKKKGEPDKKADAKDAPADGAPADAKETPAEEARIVGQHEAAEAKETPETDKSKEAEGESGQSGQEEADDEDKPGAGWLAEELEGDTDESKPGARQADALGEAHRCRGTLGDGQRCLRKPVSGTSYCREHFVPPTPRPV